MVVAAQSHHTPLFGDKLIEALIFAPEISLDQGKPLSDLGDKAQAFYLQPPSTSPSCHSSSQKAGIYWSKNTALRKRELSRGLADL